MNYSFEYIDIILLAMIAGFIFLRLRGILGKRTGIEIKSSPQFEEMLKNSNLKPKAKQNENFDQTAQKEFLKGAQIAYETIITDFSDNDNKITARELHAYVEQNVVQQSSGSQTPELQGDKDRVLVQFN